MYCIIKQHSLINLSNKVCVTNKTEDLNLSVFNMITGINESKTLTKHISWKCLRKLIIFINYTNNELREVLY